MLLPPSSRACLAPCSPSFSDSLAAPESLLPSTLAPLTELVVLMLLDIGVCGGVVKGTPATLATPDAEMLGTLPRVGVGLLKTVIEVAADGGGVCRDEVATDEIELDRVGLTARIVAAGDAGGM